MLHFTQVCVHRCSTKQIFLKIPQNSRGISFTRLFWLRHRYFSENFLKFLGTPFLQNTSGWFWIWQGFEQTRVLNKPGFWIYQGSEYAPGYEFARVLNTRVWLWVCQDSEYVRITQGSEYAWICLIMSGWICLDLSEYAGICVNMPKSLSSLVYLKAWLLVSTFSQN